MSFFSVLYRKLGILCCLPQSLLFCIHYFPLNQALKIPVLLKKPKFIMLRGRVKIMSDAPIRFGMIRLGFSEVSLYPDNGIKLELKGGKIIFKGPCTIGADSCISVNKNGILEFGNGFKATAAFKVACHYHIIFADDVLCGWETMVVDTDFHRLTNMEDAPVKSYGLVSIGRGCWLAMKTIVLKCTILPSDTVVAANSMLNKDYSAVPSKALLAGSPAKFVKSGVFLDKRNMNIDFDFSNRVYEK